MRAISWLAIVGCVASTATMGCSAKTGKPSNGGRDGGAVDDASLVNDGSASSGDDASHADDATVSADGGNAQDGGGATLDGSVSDASASTDGGALADGARPDARVDASVRDSGLSSLDNDSDGYSPADGDCDDEDDRIHPGATTIVDGRDYNCDGFVDWDATITISADDAYDLCIDGVMIAHGEGFSDAETYHVSLTQGPHVIGVKGFDLGGVISGLLTEMRVAGRVVGSFGAQSGDFDATEWRYFPTPDEGPQSTWCDLWYDDTAWGPALLVAQHGEGYWVSGARGLYGSEIDWIWDGAPRSLNTSYFRRFVTLPEEEIAPEAATPAPTCTVSDPVALGPAMVGTTRNGLDVMYDGTNLATVTNVNNRGWRAGIDDVFFQAYSPALVGGARTMVHDSAPIWGNTFPSIARAGANYGVVWEDGRNSPSDLGGVFDIYFRQLDATGTPIGASDTQLTAHTEGTDRPRIISNGTDFFVAWQDRRDGQDEIYAVKVTGAGGVGTSVRVSNSGGRSRMPKLAWSAGSNRMLIVWEDNRDATRYDGNREIYGRIYDASLSPITTEFRITDDVALSTQPSVTALGSDFVVAWADERSGNREIFLSSVSSTGAADDAMQITTGYGITSNPSIATAGSGLVLTYIDNRTGNDDVYFLPLSAVGSTLDAPLNVSHSPGASTQPAIAVMSGGQAGIVWLEERDPVAEANLRYGRIAVVSCH